MYKTCKQVLGIDPEAKDGVYQLEDGPHHCIMGDISGCGGGGWTLAMKIDGAKVCFFVIALIMIQLLTFCCFHDLCV